MYELLPPCFYPDANYYLLVRLADYCQLKGVSEKEFDRLCSEIASHQSKTDGINNLLLELGTDASWEKIKSKRDAIDARATQIRKRYQILKEKELTQNNLFNELAKEFQLSQREIKGALQPILNKEKIKDHERTDWILWDYGPCLAEHAGNTSAAFEELADRYGVSESSVKKKIKSWRYLENHLDHDWVPNCRVYKFQNGLKWSGRVGNLVNDYRKSVAIMSKDEAKEIVGKLYGFRINQVEVLIKRFPRELISKDWDDIFANCSSAAEAYERLQFTYEVSEWEVKEAIRSWDPLTGTFLD